VSIPSLLPGVRVGPYEVVAPLGAGGMGEVLRARDTRLGRDVALKVLPAAFASDTDRLMRFEREARTLAALNHPHIAHIYGLEEIPAGATPARPPARALVMELVEGEDLSRRIARGSLPLDDALAIARQIADALEAAHDAGIVHRDLKPANVKVRDDGTVKVLDFGLAKVADTASGGADSGGPDPLGVSPTFTSPAMTRAGIILGTAAYMAPEQAKGRPATKRSDIWAFGCVLYEMLTGRRAFEGEDISDTLASILKGDPDWARLPATTPAPIVRLLRRCLARDARQRLADIADARLELAEASVADAAPPVASNTTGLRERWLWAAAVLALAVGVVGVATLRKPSETVKPAAVKASLDLPPDAALPYGAVPVVSPDGRTVAFVAERQGAAQVWVRPLDETMPRAVAGTEGATGVFWSPDSRTLAFFVDRSLKRVDVAGGVATTICDSRGAAGRNGAWSPQGTIVFGPGVVGPLFRVNANGGTPEPVTTTTSGQEISHRSPSFLPDGDHFLLTVTDGTAAAVHVARLGGEERTLVVDDAIGAQYLTSGHLLFWRNRRLFLQRFDPATRQLSGEAVPVAENVDSAADSLSGTAHGIFSASAAGDVLVYTSGRAEPPIRPTWFDGSGKELGPLGIEGDVRWPSIAPDGRSVVFSRRNPRTGFYELWLHDVQQRIERRLTTANATNTTWPVWAPDSARVAFTSTRGGAAGLFVQRTSGGAAEEALLERARGLPTDWSRDGQLLYQAAAPGGPSTGLDIWALSVAGDPNPRVVLNSQAIERRPRVSPDGRWLAYMSDETSRFEIYVQSFPTPSNKWTITTTGAGSPVWSRDGSELYYMAPGGRLMAAAVKTGTTFEAQPPRPLFDVPRYYEMDTWFDVSRDGRFLIPVMAASDAAEAPISLWTNWLPASSR
jgi:Tol biopolymer transport system component